MELKFTDEEFAFLAQHEDRFHTAVHGDWVRKPIPQVLNSMSIIWNRVIGRKEIIRDSCAHCILTFMKEVGNAYYQDKAERERREKAAIEPKSEPQEQSKPQEVTTAPTQPKKAVKGRKTSNKKK